MSEYPLITGLREIHGSHGTEDYETSTTYDNTGHENEQCGNSP